MNKDWRVVCWALLVIVILSIDVKSYSDFTLKKEFSVSDIVGMLSAIAAAVAAWAAWRAADIAKSSSEDNNSFSKAQLFISHRADFVDMLDYTAKELGVIFYQKNDLYSKLFPSNHYSGDVFESSGSDEVVEKWLELRKSIVERTENGLSDDELFLWIVDCMELRREMYFEDKRQTEPQICFWAFSEHVTDTGFVSSPARHVFNISEVMSRLLKFCGRQRLEDVLLEGHPFEGHYKVYYDKIERGHDYHYVGMPGEPIIRKERAS
ncbi:hypothetical protein [Pseudomonas wadenswilerensis]|uniref:Uncharacterized protein n=1 Tax=Pseudomonas wadenswilerensis TaxID=1785161 RepID=A0A380SZT8_9PSED|nr:hypothetical protein [Pseudomonas wadenswilerensis]SUQ62761.1 hypothetical protein CCOS864_02210 [Pseudomonas wadenswilerensis]